MPPVDSSDGRVPVGTILGIVHDKAVSAQNQRRICPVYFLSGNLFQKRQIQHPLETLNLSAGLKKQFGCRLSRLFVSLFKS